MNFCVICGASVRPAARFCASCGAVVTESTESAPDTDVARQSRPTSPVAFAAVAETQQQGPDDWMPWSEPPTSAAPSPQAYSAQPALVPPPPSKRRSAALWPIVAVLALVVAGTAVTGLWLTQRAGDGSDSVVTGGSLPQDASGPGSTASPGDGTTLPSDAAGTSSSEAGPQSPPAPLRPVAAGSSSTAPDGIDEAKNRVTFGAGNAVDGDPTTAWRPVEGDGVGQFLELDLGGTYFITSVALVPGYDKIDPTSGVNRFLQNRRVQQVRWIFDDGTSVRQNFEDNASLQSMEVAATTSTIRIVIEATRSPASADPRNYAPISEVLIEGAAS